MEWRLELGKNRDRIEELVDDKELINESRRVYNENKNLVSIELKPDNIVYYRNT